MACVCDRMTDTGLFELFKRNKNPNIRVVTLTVGTGDRVKCQFCTSLSLIIADCVKMLTVTKALK